MFCRKCGKMYADDLRFCPVCGSSLDTTTNGGKMISYDEPYTDRKSKRKGKTVCCAVAWRRDDFIFRVVILRK